MLVLIIGSINLPLVLDLNVLDAVSLLVLPVADHTRHEDSERGREYGYSDHQRSQEPLVFSGIHFAFSFSVSVNNQTRAAPLAFTRSLQ